MGICSWCLGMSKMGFVEGGTGGWAGRQGGECEVNLTKCLHGGGYMMGVLLLKKHKVSRQWRHINWSIEKVIIGQIPLNMFCMKSMSHVHLVRVLTEDISTPVVFQKPVFQKTHSISFIPFNSSFAVIIKGSWVIWKVVASSLKFSHVL